MSRREEPTDARSWIAQVCDCNFLGGAGVVDYRITASGNAPARDAAFLGGCYVQRLVLRSWGESIVYGPCGDIVRLHSASMVGLSGIWHQRRFAAGLVCRYGAVYHAAEPTA